MHTPITRHLQSHCSAVDMLTARLCLLLQVQGHTGLTSSKYEDAYTLHQTPHSYCCSAFSAIFAVIKRSVAKLSPHLLGVTGTAAGADTQVQPAAASQVPHCQHRHLRGASLCISSGLPPAAARSTHSRRPPCCLSCRRPEQLQSTEQVGLLQLPALGARGGCEAMHSVLVLGKHAVLNTAAQSALICWLTLVHSSLQTKASCLALGCSSASCMHWQISCSLTKSSKDLAAFYKACHRRGIPCF